VTQTILLLLLYLLLYAGLHSLLAARTIKEWGRAHLPGFDRWYRLFYNAIALITLLPVPWLLGLPDRVLYAAPAPWSWLLWAGQGLSALALLLAVLQANPAYFVGLAQLAGDGEERGDRLVIGGLYRYVRHPLYLFSILFLWLSPVMTLNRLVLYGLATLYFYVGSLHEERRLAQTFGASYSAYQQKVPRLWPSLRRPNS
jgi:protein-S-isoprenylcysteine O-methyltransferase Ste14